MSASFGSASPRLCAALVAAFAAAAACDGGEEISGLDCDADGGTDADGDGDADTDGDADSDTDSEPTGPWVSIVSPAEGAFAPNPVELAFEAGGGVATVEFFADETYPLR